MTVYAQNSTYTEHELDLSGYDTFTRMLSDIGINVPDMELDTEMTKGEYLRSLIALFGYSETVSNYNATQNAYENEINIAYSMGWISKADKEKIISDEALTLKEAAVWMLNALGYGLKISLTSDNEENYFTEATSLKLTSGITSGWDNSISFAQML